MKRLDQYNDSHFAENMNSMTWKTFPFPKSYYANRAFEQSIHETELVKILQNYPRVGLVRRAGKLVPYRTDRTKSNSFGKQVYCPTLFGYVMPEDLKIFLEKSI